MAYTDINSEDRLVQATFAQHLEQQLGWESVYAWNQETRAPGRQRLRPAGAFTIAARAAPDDARRHAHRPRRQGARRDEETRMTHPHLPRHAGMPQAPGAARRRAAAVGALTVIAALMLAGCAVRTVELQNLEPARELARAAQPPGSVATGWRVYQQRCADCHGPSAGGGDGAPDLTERLRDIGPHRFVDLVLRRYDWGLAPGSAGAPRETLVDDIVARRQGELRMPEWQGEPVVSAHVMDLYAYLSARAQGTLAPGRPPR